MRNFRGFANVITFTLDVWTRVWTAFSYNQEIYVLKAIVNQKTNRRAESSESDLHL